MRAAVLGDDKTFEVHEVAEPDAAPGRAVVRVAGCGICGSDLHMVEAGVIPPGTVMGHEPAGIVETVGDGVEGISEGDTVAIRPFEMCGVCDACRAGASGRCEQAGPTSMGLGLRPGAFAELVEVAPSQLHPLPEDFPTEMGALVEPLAVALHGLRRSAFEPGMDVGVVGCGPIGLCAVLAARALGAGQVWAADTNAFRAGLAGDVGADATGSAPREADIVVECAGAAGTIDLAMSAARSGGQVVLLAVNIGGDTIYPFTWVVKEVDVVPGFGYSHQDFADAAEWVASGRVPVEPLVTRRVGLGEVSDAFEALLGGADDGKVLVVPDR